MSNFYKTNKTLRKINPHYKQKLKDDTIFDILYAWSDYRFENAISSIFYRSALSIFAVLVIYLLTLPILLRNLIFYKYVPTKDLYYENIIPLWTTDFLRLIIENNLLLTVFIIVFLSLLFIVKVIWNFIKFNIWFIRVIFKPLGIAFAAWSYVFRNNTIYRR